MGTNRWSSRGPTLPEYPPLPMFFLRGPGDAYAKLVGARPKPPPTLSWEDTLREWRQIQEKTGPQPLTLYMEAIHELTHAATEAIEQAPGLKGPLEKVNRWGRAIGLFATPEAQHQAPAPAAPASAGGAQARLETLLQETVGSDPKRAGDLRRVIYDAARWHQAGQPEQAARSLRQAGAVEAAVPALVQLSRSYAFSGAGGQALAPEEAATEYEQQAAALGSLSLARTRALYGLPPVGELGPP